MKRRLLSLLLVAAFGTSVLAGCGSSAPAATEAPAEEAAVEEAAPAESTGDKEVLEFYHGYYHDESEWAPAKAMRDIFDAFAAAHADGPVEFKPVPVENGAEIAQNMIAGGSFPDIIDYAGSPVPLAAISGGLALDVKPYIDANGLKDAVGINYTQNDVDGAIYTVHDQLLTRGIWYNKDIVEAAGLTVDDIQTWEGFEKLVDTVNGGNYAYIAGQASMQLLTARLASDGNADLITSPMTADMAKSDEFASAFKAVAALDQKNGSDHTVSDVGQMMADFNTNGNVAVLHNGVWNAGAIDAGLADVIQPALFPGNLSILQAGGGITIASGMSEAKEALALEFLAYMVSPEVQEKIFTQVQANPCNTTVDVVALGASAGVEKLAEACALCNSAKVQVPGLVWDGDITSVIINAFMECAVSGADIDARFDKLVDEIVAIVG